MGAITHILWCLVKGVGKIIFGSLLLLGLLFLLSWPVHLAHVTGDSYWIWGYAPYVIAGLYFEGRDV